MAEMQSGTFDFSRANVTATFTDTQLMRTLVLHDRAAQAGAGGGAGASTAAATIREATDEMEVQREEEGERGLRAGMQRTPEPTLQLPEPNQGRAAAPSRPALAPLDAVAAPGACVAQAWRMVQHQTCCVA